MESLWSLMNQDKKPLNWEHMNDVELKVELGRLVDRAKDGNEMKVNCVRRSLADLLYASTFRK